MRIIQPSYYDKFICLADKCPYTCCMEWDISVETKVANVWKSLPFPFNKTKMLASCIQYGTYDKKLKFGNDRKCNLLDENGLCHVVLKYGEENIPETCHVFPREEVVLPDRAEKALSPECPYVLDLLWEEDEYKLVESSDTNKDAGFQTCDGNGNMISEQDECEVSKAVCVLRDWFMKLFKERKESAAVMLRAVFCILRDIWDTIKNGKHEFTIKFVEQFIEDTEIDAVFEILNTQSADNGWSEDMFMEDNELFLDISERYVKQGMYTEFLQPLVTEAENIARDDYGILKKQRLHFNKLNDCFERFLRLLVWGEIGSNLVTDPDVEHILVKMEWIILEFIATRQALSLRSMIGSGLDYEKIRETVTIMSRMTGYADEDICKFMKAEFESLIWPVEYLMKVV